MKANDIYQHKRSGDIYHQLGDKFTKRFMDASDYDLINSGMGEYAGTYGGAIKLLNLNNGRTATFGIAEVRRNFVQIND